MKREDNETFHHRVHCPRASDLHCHDRTTHTRLTTLHQSVLGAKLFSSCWPLRSLLPLRARALVCSLARTLETSLRGAGKSFDTALSQISTSRHSTKTQTHKHRQHNTSPPRTYQSHRLVFNFNLLKAKQVEHENKVTMMTMIITH